MKLVQRFSRRLKTSRQYVFENIMDLDHVCVLHRKWFNNLRIRTWRPDFVDYRLTSRFYGLRQEVEVRGAPIDSDHYWYEFNSRLARIRVDGQMRGPDGDLDLTETITFEFSWLLTPVFWFLEPLFRRQKRDILQDDSALLERAYQLEQEGFHRTEADASLPRVVVFGGTGFFGRCIVKDLLDHTNARITVASRNPNNFHFGPLEGRVQVWISDYRDSESVADIIQGANVVINAVGPFQGMGLNLLKACIRNRTHYIDVADDRDFVQRAYALNHEIAEAGIMAFIGCSVVPGMSAILTQRCAKELAGLDGVRISITPGTRFTRGPGSFECLLATVGEQFSVPRDGAKETIIGWTQPERVEFPWPIWFRTVYSVVDVADYFTQVELFGARSVEFKIGSEFDWLNWALTLVRALKRWLGMRTLRVFVPLFRSVLVLASYLGTSQGALMVEVFKRQEGSTHRVKFAVYRATDGHIIPALLPTVAAAMIMKKKISFKGVSDLRDWISFEKLLAELSLRGVSLACHTGVWEKLPGLGPLQEDCF